MQGRIQRGFVEFILDKFEKFWDTLNINTSYSLPYTFLQQIHFIILHVNVCKIAGSSAAG